MKLDIHRINRRIIDVELKEITADLSQLVQESIDTVRTISEHLRPGVLDHLDLVAALKSVLRAFAERTEIECELDAGDFAEQLSQPRETAIYRICQEALTNIARHAQASRVAVRLKAIDGWLHMDIEDNGRGMPTPTPTGKSIGLVSMAERAREFGGSLSVLPGITGGACLHVVIPLEDAA